jgi:Fe-S oxidoreductase
MAFECSLCALCTAVCPVDIDPAAMFLEMRQELAHRGDGDFREHSVIINFERRGTSRRFTYYALPEDCRAVFFPGCALAGTRPQRVLDIFEHLRKGIPSLGVVFDCCAKPSHDLGRKEHFKTLFGEMRTYLLGNRVETVLVACASCYQVFKEYGGDLSVKSIYEALAEDCLPFEEKLSGVVGLHDPCAVRFEESIQIAVREIVKRSGLTIEELPHRGPRTLCCGEGGSVALVARKLAMNWGRITKEEAKGKRIVTYCAGCADFLGATLPASHLLDVVFEPEAALSGQVKVSRSPLTYWNRIRLKKRFRKLVDGKVTRERHHPGSGSSS